MSEPEFDQIFARVQAASIPYRSEPFSPEDMKVYYETITLQGLPLMVKAAHVKLSHSRMPFCADLLPGDT